MKVTLTKNHAFKHCAIYTATTPDANLAAVVQITKLKDKKGTLLRLESRLTGFYESYSIKDIKLIIYRELMKKYMENHFKNPIQPI